MEETRKRESEINDTDKDSSAALKRPRATLEVECGGGGGDDIMAWMTSMEADDDTNTMSELMNLLDADMSNAAESSSTHTTTRVKFIDNPYISPVIFQSSSSYVTINGNEESCGSSFSESDSSVMVSVDTAGIVNVAREVSAWSASELDLDVLEVDGALMDGCDGSDLDDYVLHRFLLEEEALS